MHYRSNTFFHWTLIFFVLFAYQSKHLHFSHIIDNDEHCYLCINSKIIDKEIVPLSTLLYISHCSEDRRELPLNRAIKPSKIKQQILTTVLDFSHLSFARLYFIPLGYFSHAPPKA